MSWTPANLGGVKLWLDPTRGFVAGTSWTDQISSIVYTNSGTDTVAGTGLNGHASVEMNKVGGSTYLTTPTIGSSVISATAWTALVVFNYSGSNVQDANYYDSPYLLGDEADTYWGVTVSSTKLNAAQYDGAYKNDQTSITTPGFHYAIITYNGTVIQTSIDGGSFDAGTAAGSISVDSEALAFGKNNGGTAFLKASVGDIIACNTTISTADFLQLNAWVRVRYGLTLPVCVQNNALNTTSNIGSVTLAYAGIQTAGDTNTVFVKCSVAGDITSVSDSANGSYTAVPGATITNGLFNVYTYQRLNIAAASAGANTVTVALSTTGLAVSVGIDESTPATLDSSNAAAPNTANPSMTLTTVAASTRIVAFAVGNSGPAPTAGAGFRLLQATSTLTNALILEDEAGVASGANTVAATGVGSSTSTASTIVAVALAASSVVLAAIWNNGDAPVGRHNRWPIETFSEAWEPSSPQIAKFQQWCVEPSRSVAQPNRRPAPTEYQSWEESPPKTTEWVPWMVDAVVGKADRRPAPTEYESWEQSPPQPARFQTWVNDVVGPRRRRVPPWEPDNWESSSPQLTEYQTWMVPEVEGRPNRHPAPNEYESWESSSPQPAHWNDWAPPSLQGKPARRVPPWEGDAWESSSPQIAHWQQWTNDVTAPPRRAPPTETPWSGVPFSSAFTAASLGAWTNDVTGPRVRLARVDPEAWESSPPQPSRFQTWTADVPGRGAPFRPPPTETPWSAVPRAFAPASLAAWVVEEQHGKPPRRRPPWEGDNWAPTSPQVTRWQAWTVDALQGKPARRPDPLEYQSWSAPPLVVGVIVCQTFACSDGAMFRFVAGDAAANLSASAVTDAAACSLVPIDANANPTTLVAGEGAIFVYLTADDGCED